MANPFVDNVWDTIFTGGDAQAMQLQVTIDENGQGSYPGGTLTGSFQSPGENVLTYTGTWTEGDENGAFAFFIVGRNSNAPVFLGVWASATTSGYGGQWNGMGTPPSQD
jgi:hypothetical protein